MSWSLALLTEGFEDGLLEGVLDLGIAVLTVRFQNRLQHELVAPLIHQLLTGQVIDQQLR